MKDLTIIIPSKNEQYLEQTVADVKKNAVCDTEILVGDDGVAQIGQRAMMNRLAKEAKGKYIMKLDAHCSMGYEFDKIMLEDIQDNQIMAPYMLILDAEKWVVSPHKKTSAYCFDTNLINNYHHEQENKEEINKTMVLQGACFMTLTDNYWNWNLCDESLGSWGGQGVELGIKAFLNGGECVTTKKTYFGHLFRHRENDFPYKRDLALIDQSHQAVIKKFKTKAIAELIRKWDYPMDWTKDQVDALPDDVTLNT